MKKINIKENAINAKFLEGFESEYCSKDKNVILRHALQKNDISSVCCDSKNRPETQTNFSIEIKTLPVANQKASGRCWLFAGLNVLREIIAKKCNLSKFELSQSYQAFWDRLEKVNYTLSSIIDVLDQEPNERVFMHILANGISDGGQWDMFRNLVVKYGVVPQNVYEETFQSSNTRFSNQLINSAIRQFAANAKKLHKEGKDEEIKAYKEQVLSKIYSLLVNCYGVPPTKFNFEYTDKDGNYHFEADYTPKSFFEKYVGEEIDEFVSIIHSPTSDKPYMKSFTIDYLGNVIEGKIVKHLNLPMERIKELVISQLKDNEIVWFGSDVAMYGDRVLGVWDDKAYDYPTAFGFDLKFDKADMLDFHGSAMNHAMCITGVNLRDGVATKWKIENSWGDVNGDKGYYLMSSSWFDQFTYQAVIKKKYLTQEELKAYESEPILLDPWDPMGTLA